VAFQTDYDKIEHKKINYDAISVTHCYYVIEKHHQTKVTRFFHFGPLPIKITGYANVDDECKTLEYRSWIINKTVAKESWIEKYN